MPFTPSHAAAALPFLRTPLVPAAVVVGTQVPDLAYYVRVPVPRELSHSLLGLVTVDLLLGGAVVAFWFAVLRRPVLDAAPAFVRRRVVDVGPVGWRAIGQR
ncbi:DUF4184 family protein, partial [Raoultella terrigena]|uniref:DUF4184 family protein n=1 Tax=Raoultella terrigena TaxID=577 RepID=UPI0013305F57